MLDLNLICFPSNSIYDRAETATEKLLELSGVQMDDSGTSNSSVVNEEATKIEAAGKGWYKTMISDSDYTEFENFTKWLGVSQ